jgi:hypothetical protein
MRRRSLSLSLCALFACAPVRDPAAESSTTIEVAPVAADAAPPAIVVHERVAPHATATRCSLAQPELARLRAALDASRDPEEVFELTQRLNDLVVSSGCPQPAASAKACTCVPGDPLCSCL